MPWICPAVVIGLPPRLTIRIQQQENPTSMSNATAIARDGNCYRRFVISTTLIPPGLRTLIDMAREYEEDDTPDLVGVLVQMRNGAPPKMNPEAKIYFRAVRREGLGLRRVAVRVASLAQRWHGPDVARNIRDEILRRDAIHPIFYIALSMRPDLEIETYHDVGEISQDPWNTTQLREIVGRLSQRSGVADRAAMISDTAIARGFFCHHVSCDLLGGDAAVSIFLDHHSWINGKDDEYRIVLRDLCDVEGSATRMPSSTRGFRISDHLQPIVISVKIACDEQAMFRLMMEEVDLGIVGTV